MMEMQVIVVVVIMSCVVVAHVMQLMQLRMLLMVLMLGSSCRRCYPYDAGAQVVCGCQTGGRKMTRMVRVDASGRTDADAEW